MLSSKTTNLNFIHKMEIHNGSFFSPVGHWDFWRAEDIDVDVFPGVTLGQDFTGGLHPCGSVLHHFANDSGLSGCHLQANPWLKGHTWVWDICSYNDLLLSIQFKNNCRCWKKLFLGFSCCCCCWPQKLSVWFYILIDVIF